MTYAITNYNPGDLFRLANAFMPSIQTLKRPLIAVLEKVGAGHVHFTLQGGDPKVHKFMIAASDFVAMTEPLYAYFHGVPSPSLPHLDVVLNEGPQMVCGFVFNLQSSRVALIRKKRPKWQVGRYNGIGGKVMIEETPVKAMSREALEEADLDVPEDAWRHIATYRGHEADPFTVWFFATWTDQEPLTKTDELVVFKPLEEVPTTPTIFNLQWLIPLCLDDSVEFPLSIQERHPDDRVSKKRVYTPQAVSGGVVQPEGYVAAVPEDRASGTDEGSAGDPGSGEPGPAEGEADQGEPPRDGA